MNPDHIDPDALLVRLESAARSRVDGNQRAAVAGVINREYMPWYRIVGREAIQRLIERRSDSWMLATALVDLCCGLNIDVMTVFTEDELLDSAERYLKEGFPVEHDWAWTLLWGGDELSTEVRLRLTKMLAQRCVHDDDALWMIGDGPLARVESARGGLQLVERASLDSPVLRRVQQLIRELP